jgi:P27 family predicted phage terminase small subunit
MQSHRKRGRPYYEQFLQEMKIMGRRKQFDAVTTPPQGPPVKPAGLTEVASAEWYALIIELTALGSLSTCDRAAIHMSALYAGFFAEAAADVAKNGLTVLTKQGSKCNPSLRARDDAARIRKAYLESLGLTPTSRGKVAARVADGDSKDAAFEDLLNSCPPGASGL